MRHIEKVNKVTEVNKYCIIFYLVSNLALCTYFIWIKDTISHVFAFLNFLSFSFHMAYDIGSVRSSPLDPLFLFIYLKVFQNYNTSEHSGICFSRGDVLHAILLYLYLLYTTLTFTNSTEPFKWQFTERSPLDE